MVAESRPQASSRRITSEVFQNPQEWYEYGLLLPHEPVRRGLEDMMRVLKAPTFPGSVDQKFKERNFFKWYNKNYLPFVHEHHDKEEEIYIPWLQTRCSIPSKVSEDHGALVRLLHSVSEAEALFKDAEKSPDEEAARAAAADELRSRVRTLQAAMLPHLREEEEIIPPALAKHFTAAEEGKIIDRILASMPFSMTVVMVPWVFGCAREWASPEVLRRVESLLPPPILWLNKTFWMDRHQKHNVALIESVAAEYDTHEAATSRRWSCFPMISKKKPARSRSGVPGITIVSKSDDV